MVVMLLVRKIEGIRPNRHGGLVRGRTRHGVVYEMAVFLGLSEKSLLRAAGKALTERVGIIRS